MTKTIELLIKEAQSCIGFLKFYISREEGVIKSPSIVVDKGHDQDIGRSVGKATYAEVMQTDECFTNYCTGLEGLGQDILELRTEYAQLRDECERVYEAELGSGK